MLTLICWPFCFWAGSERSVPQSEVNTLPCGRGQAFPGLDTDDRQLTTAACPIESSSLGRSTQPLFISSHCRRPTSQLAGRSHYGCHYVASALFSESSQFACSCQLASPILYAVRARPCSSNGCDTQKSNSDSAKGLPLASVSIHTLRLPSGWPKAERAA